MKKPVILMSTSYTDCPAIPDFHYFALFDNYVSAIQDAGGIPVLAPYWREDSAIEQMVSMADGVIITGGDDIQPARYGEDTRPECGKTCPERDRFELALIAEAIKQNKPLLGICRGCQLLNVYYGGTLYQDIASQFETTVKHPDYLGVNYQYGTHFVQVEKDSRFYSIMEQETVLVNSLHHQAIKDLGKGLKVMAKANDGIIEAFEVPGSYIAGYQWHPEAMFGSENYTKIYTDYVNACKK